MKQDILAISGGILTIGVIVWAIWKNPENLPRMHTLQELRAASDLKPISERSAYMRSER